MYETEYTLIFEEGCDCDELDNDVFADELDIVDIYIDVLMK